MNLFFFSISGGPDENGPIENLNKRTDMIYSFNIDYGAVDIKDHISTAIDSLESNYKIRIGLIFASGFYICLAYKITTEFAFGLVFGYGGDKLYFQRKFRSWNDIKVL